MGLVIDKLTGNVYLFDIKQTGTTAPPYMEVNTYAELPDPAANNGKIDVVRQGSGSYIYGRKDAGLYISNGTTWNRLGDTPSYFSSNKFQVYDSIDPTKGIKFVTTGITANQFRTITVQDSDGIIAYLTDLDLKLDVSVFNSYTGSTESIINSAISGASNVGSGVEIYKENVGRNLHLKTIVAGNNITISGSTDEIIISTSDTNEFVKKTDFYVYSADTLSLINTKLDIAAFTGYTGTTAPSTYLSISNFDVYSAATFTNINSRVLKTVFGTYTGTTAPSTYLSIANFNTYTGTTIPANYYNKLQINAYSAHTYSIKANLVSPAFSGTPTAPTALANSNTFQIATTAFVVGQASNLNPLMNGAVAIGTSLKYSREDHVHPIDTSRLAVSLFNTYTGTTAPNQFASKSAFLTFTGTTAPNTYQTKVSIATLTGTTLPNQYAAKSAFLLYSGTTAPNTYQSKSSIATLTGTTLPNQYATKSAFLTFTGTTAPNTYQSKSSIATLTGTTLPNQYAAKSAFLTFTGTTAPNTYQSKSSIATLTGTTLPNQYAAKSAFLTFTGTTAPNTYQLKSSIATLTGTTLPNQYAAKSAFLLFTGTTAPNTYQSKSSIAILTGTTLPNQYAAKSAFLLYTGTTAPNTYVSSASNGIRKNGGNVRLGGSLTGSTNIGLGTSNLVFTGSTGTLRYGSDLSANYNVRSLVDKGFVTGYTQVYSYNAGSAPTLRTTTKIFVGQATTNASGLVTFNITQNGQATGTPIFSTILAVQATAQNNTGTLTDVPLASYRTQTTLQTLTVNVVNSATILLGGQGLEFTGAGINVHVMVIGF